MSYCYCCLRWEDILDHVSPSIRSQLGHFPIRSWVIHGQFWFVTFFLLNCKYFNAHILYRSGLEKNSSLKVYIEILQKDRRVWSIWLIPLSILKITLSALILWDAGCHCDCIHPLRRESINLAKFSLCLFLHNESLTFLFLNFHNCIHCIRFDKLVCTMNFGSQVRE